MRAYLIADIGANHDGHLQRMHDAIEAAAAAGADMCKFQWTSDPDRMAERRRATADGYAVVYLRYLAWPAAWHEHLAECCRLRGIDYGCTVFLPEDVAVVAPYVAKFKVAAFEAEDLPLLRAIGAAAAGKDVLVSLGMGAGPAPAAVSLLRVTFLRCVSSYPAPPEALQLRALRGGTVLRGLSDHTPPELTWTGALAVAAGAEVVEAHLRLTGTSPSNPDYPHAMAPDQFAAYVAAIRFAETCLGTGQAGAHPSEDAMARYRVVP